MVSLNSLCIECRFGEIVTDNHGKHHRICACAESVNFLALVESYDACHFFETEKDESEGAE